MKLFLTLIATLTLGACGTVGTIESPVIFSDGAGLDFTSYESVVVLDFGDGTDEKDVPDYAGSNFADRIVAEIRGTGAFTNVSRESGDEQALVISGEITRYDEGNPGLKLIVGFGAGGTHFDALVRFSDAESDELLAELVVDKNSWALGGALAAGQTVEQFMKSSAEKIAKELVHAQDRNGQPQPGG